MVNVRTSDYATVTVDGEYVARGERFDICPSGSADSAWVFDSPATPAVYWDARISHAGRRVLIVEGSLPAGSDVMRALEAHADEVVVHGSPRHAELLARAEPETELAALCREIRDTITVGAERLQRSDEELAKVMRDAYAVRYDGSSRQQRRAERREPWLRYYR